MPNNLKVLNSIHENMLQRRIPSGSLQLTTTSPVEFLAAVNGPPSGFSEKMAKSLITPKSMLEIKTSLCNSATDETVKDDSTGQPKDTQFYCNHYPKDAVRETYEKKTRNNDISWKNIGINSCFAIQSTLPQTKPLAGLKNQLNTQHGIFEMHNITIIRDKRDAGVHTENARAKASSQLLLHKLLCNTGQKGEAFGEFDEPVGVAFNPEGEIIVADYNNDRLQVLSNDGQIVRVHDHYSRESGRRFAFISPAGIACDRAGNMLVAEKARNRVVILSPDGTILRAFGRHGKEQGQFRGPHGVSVDSRGRIIITDTMNSRIQVFDPDGNFLYMFGNKGPGKLNYPCYAIFHAGRFYVADTDNDCVKVFDTRGTFVRKFGDGFNAPSGISVYKNRYLIICDFSNDCVKVFSLDGRMMSQVGTSGEGRGHFFGPEAVAVSPQGKIVVTDKLNCRIQLLDFIN